MGKKTEDPGYVELTASISLSLVSKIFKIWYLVKACLNIYIKCLVAVGVSLLISTQVLILRIMSSNPMLAPKRSILVRKVNRDAHCNL